MQYSVATKYFKSKTLRKILAVVLTSAILSSCNIWKTVKLLKKGNASQSHYREEIPFEYRAGLIIIKVKIEGTEYDFIFDSGATNAVTTQLSEKLKLKQISQQKSVDAEGNTKKIGFTELNKISIGKIDFLNSGAAIIDLNYVPELSCLKVDGLIGANLMRKAIWQIDYKNQKIIFTDDFNSVTIPSGTPSLPFSPLISGTPVVDVSIAGVLSKKNVFDTGSSGVIFLSQTYFKKLKNEKSLQPFKYIKGFGSLSAGLYGRKADTSYTLKTPEIKLGNVIAKNTKIEFRKTDQGNIGSGFLKNYIVTLDWSKKTIWLDEQKKEEEADWAFLGFVPIVKEGKMRVNYVYEGCPAQESGIHLNDQIISINGIDYSDVTNEEYCEMVTKSYPWKNDDILNILIRVDNKDHKVILNKRNIWKNQCAE